MEQKIKVHAENGTQEITVTRTFDLPVELLFKAYTKPELVEQWMGNTVIKLENKPHGSYRFEKKDSNGQVVFSAHGTIHDLKENQLITRTFEMDNAGFPVQLEFLEFGSIDDSKSHLNIKMVFRSVEDRDNMLKLPFAYGLNMAHSQLQTIMEKLKQ